MIGHLRSNLTAALFIAAVFSAPTYSAFAENTTVTGKAADMWLFNHHQPATTHMATSFGS